LRLNGEEDLIDGAKDFIDLSNLCFVLKEDVGVEVGDLGIS